MEGSNIGLQWQLYQVQQLLGGEDTNKILAALAKAHAFQKEASDEKLSTGRFNNGADVAYGNRSYADVYQYYFNKQSTLQKQLVNSYVVYHDEYLNYRQRAMVYLNFIAELEEIADEKVAGLSDTVAKLSLKMKKLGIGGTVIDISLVILLMIFIPSMIVKPIFGSRDRLLDIAEGEGDLTQRIEVKRNDEMGELATAFNQFADKIHTLVSNIANSSRELSSLMAALK